MDSIFSTQEVSKISGFSLRQLNYWNQTDVVSPSIQQSNGRGTRKLYSIEDVVSLQFIRQLKRYGWSTYKIRSAITKLKTIMNDPNPLKSAILLNGKSTIIALCKTHEGERILVDSLSLNGQQIMGIVLESLFEEVIAASVHHSLELVTK